MNNYVLKYELKGKQKTALKVADCDFGARDMLFNELINKGFKMQDFTILTVKKKG